MHLGFCQSAKIALVVAASMMLLQGCGGSGLVPPSTPPVAGSATGTTDSAGKLSLRLTGTQVDITVTDTDGRPLSGISVLASLVGSNVLAAAVDPEDRYFPAIQLTGATQTGAVGSAALAPLVVFVFQLTLVVGTVATFTQIAFDPVKEIIIQPQSGFVVSRTCFSRNALVEAASWIGTKGVVSATLINPIAGAAGFIAHVAIKAGVSSLLRWVGDNSLAGVDSICFVKQEHSLLPGLALVKIEPAFVAVGGTWKSDTAVLRDGTTVLLAFISGPNAPATVNITGPPTWNGGQTWTFNVSMAAAGSLAWNELVPSTPVTGQYSVSVTGGGQTLRGNLSTDANSTLPRPTNIRVSNVTTSSVTVTWSPVLGALSYDVSVAEACGADKCPSIRSVMVPGSFVSVTVTNVPFVGGRRYFIGLRAFNTNMLQSPPPVPSQFNIGYTPSNFFDAAPGSAAVAVPSLVQEAPAKDNPVGR